MTVAYAGAGANIHPIRIQPETQTLQIGVAENNPPAGAINNPRRVFVSGSRRRRGLIFSRMIRVTWAGAPPTGYLAGSTLSIPALNEAIYNAAEQDGAAGTYLGVAIRVVGRSPQRP